MRYLFRRALKQCSRLNARRSSGPSCPQTTTSFAAGGTSRQRRDQAYGTRHTNRVRNQPDRVVDSPPKHLDIPKGAPLRLPKSFSDQFPVRVCSWVKG